MVQFMILKKQTICLVTISKVKNPTWSASASSGLNLKILFEVSKSMWNKNEKDNNYITYRC